MGWVGSPGQWASGLTIHQDHLGDGSNPSSQARLRSADSGRWGRAGMPDSEASAPGSTLEATLEDQVQGPESSAVDSSAVVFQFQSLKTFCSAL